LDSAQAREHIEMVERILAESSQRLCSGAGYFIVWGLYSGTATLSIQLVTNGVLPPAALWAQGALLLAAIAYTVLTSRAQRAATPRQSLVQREFLNVLALTLGLAFIANVGAFNIFHGWAASAIWSFAEAIVLLYIGMHGNRRAQVCGILVVVSLIVANFVHGDLAGYVLAAGMVAGYAGFGVAERLAGD